MKIEIFDNAKKKKFIDEVSDLGIEKIPYLLFKTGNERLRAFSGSFTKVEIMDIWRNFPVEGIGLYLGKQMVDKKTGKKESRLSIDALHFLKDQVTARVILNKEQEILWFKGKDVELNEEQVKDFKGSDFVAVVSAENHEHDIIGTGKITSDKKMLGNFLPKERRRKEM